MRRLCKQRGSAVNDPHIPSTSANNTRKHNSNARRGEASAPGLLSRYAPRDQRGWVLAYFFLAIPAGSALDYLLGQHFGWHEAFLMVGIPGLALALPLALSRPRCGRRPYTQWVLSVNPAFHHASGDNAGLRASSGSPGSCPACRPGARNGRPQSRFR